jgi:hypothetical protein
MAAGFQVGLLGVLKRADRSGRTDVERIFFRRFRLYMITSENRHLCLNMGEKIYS